MLTLDQIVQLMDEVAERKLGRLEIERAGFRLRIDGAPAAPRVVEFSGAASPGVVGVSPADPRSAAAGPVPETGAAAPGSAGPSAEVDPSVHVVKSPIVGTFYTAPAPDADPFVRVGDKLSKGQIICIVEAMKLMNEIETDATGEVVEIFASNGEPVEFGAPLIGIKKTK